MEFFPKWSRSFIGFSEFSESYKSLKHELASIQRSCLSHVSCWHCGIILVSYTGGGRFEPFYCKEKYFCQWIAWKYLGKTPMMKVGKKLGRGINHFSFKVSWQMEICFGTLSAVNSCKFVFIRSCTKMPTLPTFWITGILEFVRFLFESILTKRRYIESILHFSAPFLTSYLLFLNPVSLHSFCSFSFHVANLYRLQRSWGKVIFSEACVKNSVHIREQCILGDTGNKWAVRILLECILVWNVCEKFSEYVKVLIPYVSFLPFIFLTIWQKTAWNTLGEEHAILTGTKIVS